MTYLRKDFDGAIKVKTYTDKTDDVKAWLDQDPLVKDKLVSYEMYLYFGIPGDKIPARDFTPPLRLWLDFVLPWR